MLVSLGLAEQDDAAHFRLLVHNPKERVQTVAGLHRVDVVLLLHDQFDALISGSTHHVGAGVRRHRVAAGQDLNCVLLPEAVDRSCRCVQEHDGAIGSLGVHNAVLVLGRSGRGNLVGDDTGADHHVGTVGHADDAERLQLAGVALGDVMHGVHASDGEAVASGNAGGARHSHRLVTVVHVKAFSRRGGAGDCLGHLIVVGRVTGINRNPGSSSSRNAVCVIKLVGAEAGNLTNEGAVVSGQRLALKRLAAGEVVRHAVVVASGQRQVAVEILHALLVEDRLALGNIIKSGRGRKTLYNERSLSRGHVKDGHIDVARQLLLGSVTEAGFLKRITEFRSRHDPRHRLVVSNRRRNGELGVVREVRSHIGARVGLRDVRLRPPDRVVGAFHHRLIRVVDRDVAGQDKSVLEPLKKVLKRYSFFFAE